MSNSGVKGHNSFQSQIKWQQLMMESQDSSWQGCVAGKTAFTDEEHARNLLIQICIAWKHNSTAWELLSVTNKHFNYTFTNEHVSVRKDKSKVHSFLFKITDVNSLFPIWIIILILELLLLIVLLLLLLLLYFSTYWSLFIFILIWCYYLIYFYRYCYYLFNLFLKSTFSTFYYFSAFLKSVNIIIIISSSINNNNNNNNYYYYYLF